MIRRKQVSLGKTFEGDGDHRGILFKSYDLIGIFLKIFSSEFLSSVWNSFYETLGIILAEP